MQREINPQLFQQPNRETAKPVTAHNEVKDLAAHVQQLKMQNQMLERKFEQISAQYQNLSDKFVVLAGKANERRVSEAKVSELIDRHNSLIMGFENRMTHLTRIMSEQEMKLFSATAALEDARREIARLRVGRPL